MTTPLPRLCWPVLLLSLCVLPGIAAADGGLDQSFVHDVAIQGDGTIIAVGQAKGVAPAGYFSFAASRYLSDGSLDPSFGGDGVSHASFQPTPGNWSYALAVDIGGDGRIVLAGASYASPGGYEDVAVARYLTNGNLDTSFDGDGVVWFDLGSGDAATDVVVLPDDRIMLVGTHGTDLMLMRLAPDGSLDPSFPNPVFLPLAIKGGSQPQLAIQSNGKIVVTCVRAAPPDNTILLRFDQDGQLDPTFSDDGMFTLSVVWANNNEYGYWTAPLALQSGDRIVLSRPDGALIRFDTSGVIDATFHGDGSPAPTGLTYVFELEVAEDDTFSVAGATLADGFGAARLDENGSPDSGFGTGGVMHPELTTREATWRLSSVTLQDGKVILAGTAYHGENEVFTFGLARLLDDGSLDPAFDGDGRLVESDCRRIPLTSPLCVDATRAWIKIRRSETLEGITDAKSRLRWKWDGVSSAVVEPTDEFYTLCAYDTHSGDPELADWLRMTEVKLKPLSNGRQRLSSKAGYKNPEYFTRPEVPEAFSAERYFEQNPTTIVQLVRSDGTCFVSTFTEADTSRNEADRFQARSE